MQARAEGKEKAEDERFKSNRKGSAHTVEDMAKIPASMEKEKEKERTNGRAERKTPTLQKAKERAKIKARVKENPMPRVVSPSRQKAPQRSRHKLQQHPLLPQKTGVGTQKKIGRRGKKVLTLQRTIKTKAREGPQEAKTKTSYVYLVEAQMD